MQGPSIRGLVTARFLHESYKFVDDQFSIRLNLGNPFDVVRNALIGIVRGRYSKTDLASINQDLARLGFGD